MRIALVALVASLAAGCGDRRSFDERYSDSQNEIERRAERIDRELANKAKESEPEDSSDRGKR